MLSSEEAAVFTYGGMIAHVLTFDSSNRSSITSCITSARENVRQVREEISSEQWQRVNRLFHQVAHYNLTESLDVLPSEFLLSVIEGIHLFQGVTDSTMGHGEGWQFIQVGRYIERASATANLLNLYHREFWGQAGNPAESSEYLEWIGLLRSCTAFEAYCKTYTADLNPDRILEFLLLNPEFPHAVRYSIDCLQTALDAIHGEGGKRRAAPLTRPRPHRAGLPRGVQPLRTGPLEAQPGAGSRRWQAGGQDRRPAAHGSDRHPLRLLFLHAAARE